LQFYEDTLKINAILCHLVHGLPSDYFRNVFPTRNSAHVSCFTQFRPVITAFIFFKRFEGVPRQAEVAQGVPGRQRQTNGRFSGLSGTTSLVGRQPNVPAAFTLGEIPGTHFQRLSRPRGTWFCRGYHGKKSPVKPSGIDPGTI